MLVVADKAFFNSQMIQKLQRYPGVLRCDEIRLGKSLGTSLGDIPQIADGRGDKVQHCGHRSLLKMIDFPVGRGGGAVWIPKGAFFPHQSGFRALSELKQNQTDGAVLPVPNQPQPLEFQRER